MKPILQLAAIVVVALVCATVYTMVTKQITFKVPEGRYRNALVCDKPKPAADPAGGSVSNDVRRGADGLENSASTGSAPAAGDAGTGEDPTTAGTATSAGGSSTDGSSGETTEPSTADGETDAGKTPRIQLAEAFQYWQEGTLFIDARRTKHYVKGHIPGAVSISPWETEREQRILELAQSEPHEAPVIVYCTRSEDCHDSEEIAGDLRQMGFTDIWVFQGGWPEWEEAKKPQAKGEEPGVRGES